MLRILLKLTTALSLSFALVVPTLAQETSPAAPKAGTRERTGVDAGAYLAGRNAEMAGDFRAAAHWFSQALAADPINIALIDGATFAALGLGDIARAAELAKIRKSLPMDAQETQLADLAELAQAAYERDFDHVKAALDADKALGPLVAGLGFAWADVGRGDMAAALKGFEAISKRRGLAAYGLYHQALALAVAGDFEGADALLSREGLSLNRRGILAHIQILSQLERNDAAIALLDATWPGASEPVVDQLRARLVAGEQVPFDIVRDAREGLAEVFWTFATLIGPDSEPAFVLVNARIAAALKPDHDDAALLGAAMLEDMGQYELAEDVYQSFATDHPAYFHAQLGRADALFSAGKRQEAVEVVQKLTEDYGDVLLVQASLGDMLRRIEDWPAAEAAYRAAIALLPNPTPASSWGLFFSLGITLERQKKFEEGDEEFRRSLELNPNRAEVLNYLGYGLIDRGANLDEALAMIEQAVAAEPESGYIIDSLAWAYFKLGRYQDALEPMEKASVLEPVDPIVTDHLGDVYWMNGRKREAQFQWRRALSYQPEEEDALRIRRKLELGLDAVLAEEERAGAN